MFTDEVVITVIGGKGGNGSISFRREKFVPFGGPDGGDGGHGGAVILQSERNLDTLSEYRMKKVFPAMHGVGGGGQKLTGKTAAPLILKIPTGTAVYDAATKELLHDFVEDKDQFTVVNGGRGGYGNAHFTSSTRQAPRFAELGDRGEERKIRLALKLIADVGIIGFPNAGKSSFITRVSAAKPAIANYPFTSLIESSAHLFLAQDLTFSGSTPDGTEQIQLVKMSFEQAVEKVLKGEIFHAPSALLILKAKEQLKKK